MPLLNITMYDSMANAPKGLLDWPYHLFQLILNQVKRVWQSTFSEQDIIANCKNFSPENVYYLTPQQLTYLRKIPVDRIVDLRPLAISCYTKTKEKLLNSLTFDQLTRLQLDEIIAIKIADQFRPDVKEHLEAIIPIFSNDTLPAALLTIELGKQKKLEAFFQGKAMFIDAYRRFDNCPQNVQEGAKKCFCLALSFAQLVSLARYADDATITTEIVKKFQPKEESHRQQILTWMVDKNRTDRAISLINRLQTESKFSKVIKELPEKNVIELFIASFAFSYSAQGQDAINTIAYHLVQEVISSIRKDPSIAQDVVAAMIAAPDWEYSLSYDQFVSLVASFKFPILFGILLRPNPRSRLDWYLYIYIGTYLSRLHEDLKAAFKTLNADQLSCIRVRDLSEFNARNQSLEEGMNALDKLYDQRIKELWFSSKKMPIEDAALQRGFLKRCTPQELIKGDVSLSEEQIDDLLPKMRCAHFAKFFDFPTLHRLIVRNNTKWWDQSRLSWFVHAYIGANLNRLQQEIETCFSQINDGTLRELYFIYGANSSSEFHQISKEGFATEVTAAHNFFTTLYYRRGKELLFSSKQFPCHGVVEKCSAAELISHGIVLEEYHIKDLPKEEAEKYRKALPELKRKVYAPS